MPASNICLPPSLEQDQCLSQASAGAGIGKGLVRAAEIHVQIPVLGRSFFSQITADWRNQGFMPGLSTTTTSIITDREQIKREAPPSFLSPRCSQSRKAARMGKFPSEGILQMRKEERLKRES